LVHHTTGRVEKVKSCHHYPEYPLVRLTVTLKDEIPTTDEGLLRK
jgi:hypothetical protein